MKEIRLNGERVFLKKSFDGWRVVYPPKIDDRWNLKNLLVGGSYWNIVKTLIIIGLIIFVTFSYNHDISAIKEIADSCQENACEWCSRIIAGEQNQQLYIKEIEKSLSNIDISDYII